MNYVLFNIAVIVALGAIICIPSLQYAAWSFSGLYGKDHKTARDFRTASIVLAALALAGGIYTGVYLANTETYVCTSPACNYEVWSEQELQFCQSCGGTLAIKAESCPTCGHAYRGSPNFCPMCGELAY